MKSFVWKSHYSEEGIVNGGREKDWWFRAKLSKLGKFNSLETLELQIYNDVDCLVKLQRTLLIVLIYIAR